MQKLCTVLICFVCFGLGHSFAADGLSKTVSDQRPENDSEIIDVESPLFDYPISRALGIDVPALLIPAHRAPSVYDLVQQKK